MRIKTIKANKSFPIDAEHFNKQLSDGIWATDGFELLAKLIRPIPDFDEDAHGPVGPTTPDKGIMDKSF